MLEFLEWRGYRGDSVVQRFFVDFVRGVFAARLKIDSLIKPYCVKFKFERLLATDRAVLRLAASELILSSAPMRVVLDEAIELARTYGDQASPKFVNAVLDKVVAANFKPNQVSEELGVFVSEDESQKRTLAVIPPVLSRATALESSID
jgi:N utilization substance protein B